MSAFSLCVSILFLKRMKFYAHGRLSYIHEKQTYLEIKYAKVKSRYPASNVIRLTYAKTKYVN